MPAFVIGVIFFISFFVLLFTGVFWLSENCKKSRCAVILTLIVDAGFIAWLIPAYNTHVTTISLDDYPVETITYKDGTEKQIISISASEKVDVSDLFHIHFPEGTIIEKQVNSKWAGGIFWQDTTAIFYSPILPSHKNITTQPAAK
jgi:hypothetical protein